MESGKHFLFTTRPVSDAQLRTIYASDQEMYPAPLSFDRLRSWVDACPDLAIAFHEDGDATRYSGNNSSPASGVIIVLSLLRTYWEDLLVGKVKEVDIDATVMFPPVEIEDGGKNEVEVGLHVFHVERFWGSSTGAASTTSGVRAEDTQAGKSGSTGATAPRKGFAEVAVDEAVRRVGGVCESSRGGVEQSCGEGMRRWRICGLSALTATEAGKKTFGRMGFVPTGYKEIFVTAGEGDGESAKLKMVCVYPSDGAQSVDLPKNCEGTESEPSEMVVKYL